MWTLTTSISTSYYVWIVVMCPSSADGCNTVPAQIRGFITLLYCLIFNNSKHRVSLSEPCTAVTRMLKCRKTTVKSWNADNSECNFTWGWVLPIISIQHISILRDIKHSLGNYTLTFRDLYRTKRYLNNRGWCVFWVYFPTIHHSYNPEEIWLQMEEHQHTVCFPLFIFRIF